MTTETVQSSSILVHRATISYLWTEVLPGFLEQRIPSQSPFAFCTRYALFPKVFEQARDRIVTTPRFEVPWRDKHRQHFWERYLAQVPLGFVPGTQAWNSLVPLRFDPGIRLVADWFAGSSSVEGFYYPFGTAVAITFRWEPKLPLEEMLPKAYDFTRWGKFSLASDPSTTIALEDVADRAFTALRENALGNQPEATTRTQQPISLVTVVKAEGVDPHADIRRNTAILHALDVLAAWPNDLDYHTLPDPDAVCLPVKRGSPAGCTLYAQERGRVVWHPDLFLPSADATPTADANQSRRTSALSCYHRNLLFGSLQAESLGMLISYTARLFENGTTKVGLSYLHCNAVTNAAKCLSKLYIGDKGDTWRSSSVPRQIKQSSYNDLQKILPAFGLPALP
jgi:hypothetical protein